LKDLKQPEQVREPHSPQLQHCEPKQPQLGLQSLGHEQHPWQPPQGLQPEQLGRVQVQQLLHWNLQHEGSLKQLQPVWQHEPQFGLQHSGMQHEPQLGLQLQLGLQDGQSGLQQDTSQHEQLFGPQHGLLHDLQLGLQHDTSGHEQHEQ